MNEAERRSIDSWRLVAVAIGILTILLAMSVQFGGVVWFASSINGRVDQLSRDIEIVQKDIKEEREKTGPIIHQFHLFVQSLQEIKHDVREIKSRVIPPKGKPRENKVPSSNTN